VKRRVPLQSGVVDQDIDGAEPFDRVAEHVLDLVLLRHVGFVCISLGARSTDRIDHRLGLAGHVIDHDIGTGLPESDRGRLADAGIGAGDQCLLASQNLRNGPLRGAGWHSDVLLGITHDRLPLTSIECA
jgi:hypothetical protein